MSTPTRAHNILAAATPTLRQRIAAKIAIDPVTGCHNWLGAYSTKRGWQKRPVVQLGKRGTPMVNVARIVLEWKDGPPATADLEAGHTCPHGENWRCVNEDHLQWMTRVENERRKRRGLPEAQ